MLGRKRSTILPNKELSYGSIYFLLKNTTYEINVFSKEEISTAKRDILQQARKLTSYAVFMKAAIKFTGLSEAQLKRLMRPKEV